jgi:hypothetical protein
MTKRLQVLVPDAELRDIQRLARRRHLTTAEWVRQALRAAHKAEVGASAVDKLAAIRQASAHAFPIGEIDSVLADIERGYAGVGVDEES